MKTFRWILAVGLAIPLLVALPMAAFSKVKDTPHNLSGLLPGKTSVPGGTTQVCLPCHTPHFSEKEGGVAVNYAWNHELSAGGWTLHDGADAQSMMNHASRLCLSCHDGTVAIDSFGLPDTADSTGEKPKTGSVFMPFAARLGTDLTNHHPVGVDYPLTSSRYEKPTGYDPTNPSWSTASYTVISADPTLVQTGASARIVEGTVQCESCHFAHGSRAADTRMFLRVDNSNSKLCSSCHVN